MRGVGLIMVASLGVACLDGREVEPEAACEPTPTQFCSRVHEPGLQDPNSPDFHGQLVRSLVYDLTTCRNCHGEGLAGGTSGSSCLNCHQGGVYACDNCHRGLPEQGAHQVHLSGGLLGLQYDCDTCHLKPATVFSPGHFQNRGELDPPPVEVILGAAAQGPGAVASFDHDTGTCANVECHGASLMDPAASIPVPTWRPGVEQSCGRCHGMPPASHRSDRCQDCHPRVANAEGLVDASLHLDGKIDLGDGSGTCHACHVEQGQHHSEHAEAKRHLRGPMGCQECHLVPQQVNDPGHLDSPPPGEVFPRSFGGLAEARNAQPEYANGRCNNTYCHGAGSSLGLLDGPEVVYCGSCHGIPPIDLNHQAEWAVTECSRCHSTSVDPYGNPLFDEGGHSHHLDGIVDHE